MILRLMSRGYTIAAIKELTDAWDSQRGLADVLGLDEGARDALRAAREQHRSLSQLNPL